MARALLLLVISLLGVGGPALAQTQFKEAVELAEVVLRLRLYGGLMLRSLSELQ
jgi:hypothetical protein